jgi:arabinose-5-phosphate isomerase
MTGTSQDKTDLEYARSVVESELAGVHAAAARLDSDFLSALTVILTAPPGSRLVVSGMGKAGFVAMKLSATLASIGFPSFFLHPADAVHGDLGRLSSSDIVLILSHSGETEEIVRLVPKVRAFGASIISLTASRESTLGQHSDLVIETGKIAEAGPLGLAPTTSTTVMMVIGDALAMTLLKKRGLSREEFARFHPGGDLGRSLMLVEEIMRTGQSHCVVEATKTTREVLRAINATQPRPGAAAIVDDSGKLVGIFTDGNLGRCLEGDVSFLDATITEVASKNPKTIGQKKLVTEASRLLSELKIDQLIVVDEANIPVGLIDVQDLLACGMIKVK